MIYARYNTAYSLKTCYEIMITKNTKKALDFFLNKAIEKINNYLTKI